MNELQPSVLDVDQDRFSTSYAYFAPDRTQSPALPAPVCFRYWRPGTSDLALTGHPPMSAVRPQTGAKRKPGKPQLAGPMRGLLRVHSGGGTLMP